MTQNTTPNDFISMQEQAIKRVREMQQKSSPPKQSSITESPVKETFEKGTKAAPRVSKKESVPEAPSKPAKETDTKKKSEKENPNKENSSGLFSSLLNIDADMSIILPLILFLGKDGADDVLLLALLYIMS